jgi:hypothetical protein
MEEQLISTMQTMSSKEESIFWTNLTHDYFSAEAYACSIHLYAARSGMSQLGPVAGSRSQSLHHGYVCETTAALK